MFKRLLLIALCAVFGQQAQAKCYVTQGSEVPPGMSDPAYGIYKLWSGFGTFDPTTSRGIFPDGVKQFNVGGNASATQPTGTQLAFSGVLPFAQYANGPGYYDDEQVLYVCDDDADLYEIYAIKPDYYHIRRVLDAGAPEFTYTTATKNIGYRLKNESTGNYFTPYAQYRKLTGLDVDGQGNFLVKAKNFSQVSLELIKIPDPVLTDVGQASGSSSYPAKYTYGMGIARTLFMAEYNYAPNCPEGVLLSSCNYESSSKYNAPGLTGIGGVVYSRSNQCVFKSVTPHVTFAPISTLELQQGLKRQGIFQLEYSCDAGAYLGTGAGTSAIGFKVSSTAYQAATAAGFKVSTGTGVTRLLSEGYGTDSAVATGVGITLMKKGDTAVINWLSNSAITAGGNKDGWYTPHNTYNASGEFLAEYDVTLSRLNTSIPITSGAVYATAEVIIKLQ